MNLAAVPHREVADALPPTRLFINGPQGAYRPYWHGRPITSKHDMLPDRLDAATTIRIYDGSTDLNAAADPLCWTFSIATILDELT